MPLGEHVGDFLAAFNKPVLHLMLPHDLFHLRAQPPALAHIFHDVKGRLGGQAFVHQGQHDVVPGADALLEAGGLAEDQVPGVAAPHIGAVGKAGDADQVCNAGGLGLVQNPPHKGGAKFRDAQCTGGASQLFLGQPQGFGGGEQGQHIFVIQRDVQIVHPGQALHHADHGGVIMPQHVHLDQDVVHGAEVKVGGDGLGVIVGGILHRGKLGNLITHGQNHHAARVLSRGALHPDAAVCQALFFSVGNCFSPFLQVFKHKAKSGLFLQGTDGTGPEDMALAKQFLHIGMGGGLVLTAEIQVNVRHLVPLEAQEDLKGNVITVLHQRATAGNAVFIREILAHLMVFPVHLKVHRPANRTAVMGRQGVHLGDAAHGGHKGGAHRAPAAHHIAFLLGAGDQLVGDQIEGGIAIADDGLQFLVHPLPDQGGQFIPVKGVGIFLCHALDVFRRRLPDGGKGGLVLRMTGVQRDLPHLFHDHPGICYYNLLGFFLFQPGKVLKHLLSGLEIERRLMVAVPGLRVDAVFNDGAEYGVVRLQKAHIPRGADRNAQLLPQADQGFVHLTNILKGLQLPAQGQQAAVLVWLHLNKVIKAGDLFQFSLGHALQHSLE